MASLMILNPRRRKVGAKKRKRKMTAKQLKFFGPRKGKKKKAKAKKAKAQVIVVTSNPKGKTVAKKKRRHTRRKAKVFTHNPKSKRRRFRRNPRSIEAGFLNNTLMPAAIGAAGAIGTDMLIGYLPIPPQFKQGLMLPVLKIAGALLVGMAVGAVSNREAGEEAAAGGVIVTLYSMAKGFSISASGGGMNRYAPMRRYAPMKGIGYMPPGAMMRPGGGGNMRGLGYQNPARIAGPYGMPSRANMRYLSSR